MAECLDVVSILGGRVPHGDLQSRTVAGWLRRWVARPIGLWKSPSVTNCPFSLADPGTPSPFPADAWPKLVTVAGQAHHKGQLDAVKMAERLLPHFPKLAYRLIGIPAIKSIAITSIRPPAAWAWGPCAAGSLEPGDVRFAAMREADLYIQASLNKASASRCRRSDVVSALLGTDTGTSPLWPRATRLPAWCRWPTSRDGVGGAERLKMGTGRRPSTNAAMP